MKTNQKPDKKIHIRKKVAGGTTGAVIGAVVGGPVGALVGGVIGTMVGGAAETGKLQGLTDKSGAKTPKPLAKAKAVAKRAVSKPRAKLKAATKPKRGAAVPKSKAMRRA